MIETSANYFSQIISVIREFDISEDECLNAAGLTEYPKTNRVPAALLSQILNFAAKRVNEPCLGMKCGLRYPILQYTRPSEFLKLCKNLRHAADIYNRYCPLFHTIGVPSGVISENNCDRMVWRPNFDDKQTDDYRQLTELIITNFVTSINWLAWKTPNAVECVYIKHKSILPKTYYEELFECDIKFNQDEYSLILKAGVKNAPFSSHDPVELAKIMIKFDVILNELLEQESLVDRTELQIRRALEHHPSNKASIAKALGLSERSMTRALKTKGTSFREVKNRVFKNLAISKINQGVPIIEVAQSLGYNDQAAFTRAYKRWFGSPPRRHNALDRQ